MVLATVLCRFSGLRVYPGHGTKLARVDGQTFLFMNAKCKRLFNNKLKPSKLAWTALYRKHHKKDIDLAATRKKKTKKSNVQTRSIVGVSLEVIQKRRSEKTEVRAAARDAALREIKERAKKEKAEKAVKKAEVSKKAPVAKTNVVKSAPKASKAGKR